MRCLLAAPQLHTLELTPRNMTLAPEHMHVLGARLLISLQPAESLLCTVTICMCFPLQTLELTPHNMMLAPRAHARPGCAPAFSSLTFCFIAVHAHHKWICLPLFSEHSAAGMPVSRLHVSGDPFSEERGRFLLRFCT